MPAEGSANTTSPWNAPARPLVGKQQCGGQGGGCRSLGAGTRTHHAPQLFLPGNRSRMAICNSTQGWTFQVFLFLLNKAPVELGTDWPQAKAALRASPRAWWGSPCGSLCWCDGRILPRAPTSDTPFNCFQLRNLEPGYFCCLNKEHKMDASLEAPVRTSLRTESNNSFCSHRIKQGETSTLSYLKPSLTSRTTLNFSLQSQPRVVWWGDTQTYSS